MSSIIEDRLRQRAEQEKAAAEAQVVEGVVKDAEAAEVAQAGNAEVNGQAAPEPGPGQPPVQPQIAVPMKQKQLTVKSYFKDATKPPIVESTVLQVPDRPDGEEQTKAIVYLNMRQVNALIIRSDDGTTSFYTLDQFERFEFSFSQIVSGVSGVPLAVKS